MHILPLALVLPLACTNGIQVSPDETGREPAPPVETDVDSSEEPPDTCGSIVDVEVSIHPEVSTILEVTWSQTQAVEAAWLEFSFENDEWHASPERSADPGPHHEVILGVPAETPVTFRVVNRADGTLCAGTDMKATTGSLPYALLEPVLMGLDPLRASPEPFMLGSIDVGDNWYYGPFYVFILDRQGRCVWYRSVPDDKASLFAQISADGTHLIYDATTHYVWDQDVAPTITRTTLDLQFVDETILPDMGFTFDEIEDGSIIYEHEGGRGEYSLWELSPNGDEHEIWDCVDYLDSIRERSELCMPNSVVWHASGDSIFWSMFQNDTVMEIDRQTGEVRRQFGQLDGGWVFDPPDAVVDYQHYPNYTPDGTLIVSTHSTADRRTQYAREFRFDDDSDTLHEIWNYSTQDYYADYGGEAQRLSNGNALLCYGTDGAMREVAPDGAVVWDLAWPAQPNTHLLGHNTLIDDLYAINEGPVK